MDLMIAIKRKEIAISIALQDLKTKHEAILAMEPFENEWDLLPPESRGKTPFALLDASLKLLPGVKREPIGNGRVRLWIET